MAHTNGDRLDFLKPAALIFLYARGVWSLQLDLLGPRRAPCCAQQATSPDLTVLAKSYAHCQMAGSGPIMSFEFLFFSLQAQDVAFFLPQLRCCVACIRRLRFIGEL